MKNSPENLDKIISKNPTTNWVEKGGDSENLANYQLIPLTRADLPELCLIDSAVFNKSAFGSSNFESIIGLPQILALGVKDVANPLETKLKSYIICQMADDVADVLTIATTLDSRKRHLAESLLKSTMLILPYFGVGELLLEVRESNIAAINLYLKLGAKKVGERRDYYQSPKEDAKVLSLKLS